MNYRKIYIIFKYLLKHIGAVNQWRSFIAHVTIRGVWSISRSQISLPSHRDAHKRELSQCTYRDYLIYKRNGNRWQTRNTFYRKELEYQNEGAGGNRNLSKETNEIAKSHLQDWSFWFFAHWKCRGNERNFWNSFFRFIFLFLIFIILYILCT